MDIFYRLKNVVGQAYKYLKCLMHFLSLVFASLVPPFSIRVRRRREMTKRDVNYS